MNYFEEQSFDSIEVIPLGEYEGCTFLKCNFSNSNFSDYKFIECEFIECNLSNIRLD